MMLGKVCFPPEVCGYFKTGNDIIHNMQHVHPFGFSQIATVSIQLCVMVWNGLNCYFQPNFTVVLRTTVKLLRKFLCKVQKYLGKLGATVGYLLGVFFRLWIPFLARFSTSA